MRTPSPLYLYELHPSDTGRVLAALTVRRVDPLPSADGFEIALDADWVGPDPQSPPRWMALNAEMWSRLQPSRRIGAIHIDSYDLPDLVGLGRRSVSWDWFLPPDEIEQTERDRAPNSANALPLRFRAAGLLRVDEQVVGVAGDTSIEMSAGEWSAHLRTLRYETAPAVVALAREAAARHASWSEAEQRLRPAREALRTGGERAALAGAFKEFERLANYPYRADEWEAVLAQMPAAKGQQLRKLLAAHSGMLSRVGRHLDSEADEQSGERGELPLEYWEAELLIAASQLLLAYALRLRPVRG